MPKVPSSYLEARRSEIMDAAIRCTLRNGLHQTTMQDICKEAGLSSGAPYRYFDNKDEILRAIIERGTQRVQDVLGGMIEAAPDAVSALDVLTEFEAAAFHESEFEDLVRLDIESWPEILRHRDLGDALRQRLAFQRAILADMLQNVPIASADHEPYDPDALANLLIAFILGLRFLSVLDSEGVDSDAVFSIFKRVLADQAGLTSGKNEGSLPGEAEMPESQGAEEGPPP